MDDWALLRQYISGDKGAIESLIRRHIDFVYSTAIRAARISPSDADDITQAVFLLLTQKASGIKQRGTLVGWLYRATRWCAANLNKQERRRQKLHEEAVMQIITGDTTADHTHAAWLEEIDAALERLSEKERAAIIARYLQQKSFAQAGEMLGLSAEAVRKQAQRGLEKLRGYLLARNAAAPSGATIVASLASTLKTAPGAMLDTAIGLPHGAPAAAHIAALVRGAPSFSALSKVPLVLTIAAILAITGAIIAIQFQAAQATTPIATAPAPSTAATPLPPSVPAPNLPPIELIAADSTHPTEAEVKNFLKGRLNRLSNLSVDYTAKTEYIAPPGGWPKPSPPPDGMLTDEPIFMVAPATLADFSIPLGSAENGTIVTSASLPRVVIFPSGTVESTKSLALLNGNARYQRTITHITREAPFPDWLKLFQDQTTIAHGDTVDRLYYFANKELALKSSNSAAGLLPEPDIESALALAANGRPAMSSRPIANTSRTFVSTDIDAFTISFPDANHVQVSHEIAAVTGRSGARGRATSNPSTRSFAAPGPAPTQFDPVREEWTLDRSLGYAPVAYRRVQWETIEMTMYNFHEVGGLKIPQKVVARHIFPIAGAPQTWRIDTLNIQQCRIQDPANTPDRYIMRWPENKPPEPAAPNTFAFAPEAPVGAESTFRLFLTLRPVATVPGTTGVRFLDENAKFKSPAARIAALSSTREGILGNNLPLFLAAANRSPWWLAAHQSFLDWAKKGGIDVLFLGDELVEDWDQPLWKDHFSPLKAVNFGLRVDRVQNLLWRISNGELQGLSPKVTVLLTGSVNAAQPPLPENWRGGTTTLMPPYGATAVNDTPPRRPEEPGDIADDIVLVIHALHEICPNTKILLLGVPPQGANPTSARDAERRSRVDGINAKLATFDDGTSIRYLDLSEGSIQPDGTLSPEDFINGYLPTPKTYERWTKILDPILREIMNNATDKK